MGLARTRLSLLGLRSPRGRIESRGYRSFDGSRRAVLAATRVLILRLFVMRIDR